VSKTDTKAEGRKEKTYEVARNIHEVEIFRADELDGRSLEQSVVLLADVGGVLDGFTGDLMDVGASADDSDWMGGKSQYRSASRAKKRSHRSPAGGRTSGRWRAETKGEAKLPHEARDG
jgi:hypothetical protein